MTETEQRIAIAEASGVTPCLRHGNEYHTSQLQCVEDECWNHYVSDYPNDLNAMSDVVNSLSLDDRLLWLHWMDVVTSDPNDKKDQAWFPLRLASAKSDKWAEAFLRAIGKWKD